MSHPAATAMPTVRRRNDSMSVESTKPQRRYSLSELLVYVSLFALAFAGLRLESAVGLAAFCLFGALLGIGFAAVLTGRKHFLAGAIVGGIVLPMVLFIAFSIVVYRTHSRPRTVIVQPRAGLKAQLNVENDK